ncbi:hypothetical protein [Nocardioides ungokensis]|uniref:hypothetical protein n=1 Tax=Nocardioides ungokensis TaxID=1643322 RepID=UPI0015DE98B2|nr:hypothetical protein [Nocardioides ungokensis]
MREHATISRTSPTGRLRRRLALLVTGAAGALVLAAPLLAADPGAAQAAARHVTDVSPSALDRGPARSDAHLEGQRLVHGDLSVRIPGRRAVLVGYGVENHLVGTRLHGRWVTIRVDADGTRKRIATGLSPYTMTYSEDGRLVASSRFDGDATRVVVRSTADGSTVARRTFRDGSSVLTLDSSRVVLGSWAPARTRTWQLDTGRLLTVAHQAGYRADLTHGLLATLTDDPYQGGCSVLRRLNQPATRLWRSCDERVERFSPDGRHLTSVALLSDGAGPSQVLMRSVRGQWQAAWRVTGGWIDVQGWEGPDTWVGEVHGPHRSAGVRCTGGDCERTSAPRPTDAP